MATNSSLRHWRPAEFGRSRNGGLDRRKRSQLSANHSPNANNCFICRGCERIYHFHIGLHSYSKRCIKTTWPCKHRIYCLSKQVDAITICMVIPSVFFNSANSKYTLSRKEIPSYERRFNKEKFVRLANLIQNSDICSCFIYLFYVEMMWRHLLRFLICTQNT